MTYRILHVLSSLDLKGGGPAVSLQGLALAQRKVGLDVRVLCSAAHYHDSNAAASVLGEHEVSVRLVGPARGKRVTHPDLRGACLEECRRADIVHIHGLWESIQSEAARAARIALRPYIFRPCGMLDPWSMGQRSLLKKVALGLGLGKRLKQASAIHYVTLDEAENGRRLLPQVKPIVEPNGVTIPTRRVQHSDDFRRRHSIPFGMPILLFLSRLHFKKGLDYLLDAAADLCVDGIDFRLVLAGRGKPAFETELTAMISSRGLSQKVLRVGMLVGNEKEEVLAAADLFVLPSRHENFGVAVAEAMASGVPVIISDQVALKREVLAAHAGIVVPLDSVAFARAISHLVLNAGERENMGQRGREFASQHFDWLQIAARWSTHYAELVAASPMPT